MGLRARVLYEQHRLEEARSEVLRAIEVSEKLGAAKNVGRYQRLLRRDIQKEILVASDESDLDDEFFETLLLPARIDLRSIEGQETE